MGKREEMMGLTLERKEGMELKVLVENGLGNQEEDGYHFKFEDRYG